MDSVDVLHLVNQDRNKFGLRDSDYHRYRVHCTNKLKNLRKSIGLQQVNTKTKQFQPRAFDLQAIDQNHNLHLKYFLISLFQVEHSWASSREIREQIQIILKKPRQENSTSSPTGVSRLRKHSQNRLAKAIQHSHQLLELCSLPSHPVDVETLAQVYVHRFYMKGLFNFESARWESSLDHFVVSFVILKALGNSPSKDNQHLKKRAIFYQSMDELSPMIRYCGYKLGLDSIEIDKFSQERFDQTGSGQQLIKETDWNPIKLLIESSKEFDQPVIELNFIDKLVSIRNPELIDLITNVKRADEILLSALGDSSMADSLGPSTEQTDSTKTLNKKQRRKLFLQSKNPKMENYKGLRISSTAGFDRALAIYTEAETSLQGLLESTHRALESNSTIQRFDQQSKLLSTVHEMVGFRLLSTRVRRDLGLIKILEKKLIKQQVKIQERIKNNFKNYQNINKLITITSTTPNNKKINHKNKTCDQDLIKSLLVKRRQTKLFPSILKLIQDILFNLDRIKQLNLIQDHHLLNLKLESHISFFKAYRCFIQSKSYLLIEKFLESYVLQQKSNYYIRQTYQNLEEIDQEESEMEGEIEEEEGSNNTEDLNLIFLNFDKSKLNQIGQVVQDQLKLEIIQQWINNKNKQRQEDLTQSHQGQDESESEGMILDNTQVGLKNLTLIDHDQQQKQQSMNNKDAKVFDIAFNYVTQFDWDQLSQGQPQQGLNRVLALTSHPTTQVHQNLQTSDHSKPAPNASDSPPPPPSPKKSSGFWSFFSRS